MDTKTLIRSWPIVSMPGVPTDRKEVLQDTRHVLGRERTCHFSRRAFARVLVDYG